MITWLDFLIHSYSFNLIVLFNVFFFNIHINNYIIIYLFNQYFLQYYEYVTCSFIIVDITQLNPLPDTLYVSYWN